MPISKQALSRHSLRSADTFKTQFRAYNSSLAYMYNIINSKKLWLGAETLTGSRKLRYICAQAVIRLFPCYFSILFIPCLPNASTLLQTASLETVLMGRALNIHTYTHVCACTQVTGVHACVCVYIYDFLDRFMLKMLIIFPSKYRGKGKASLNFSTHFTFVANNKSIILCDVKKFI